MESNSGAAPAAQHSGELPRQVGAVVDAHVQAVAAGRRIEMRGVAREEDAAVAVALGDEIGAGVPWPVTEDLDRDIGADRLLDHGDDLALVHLAAALGGICVMNSSLAVQRDHHQTHVGVDRHVHPGAAMADEFRIEVGNAQMDGREQAGEEHVHQLRFAAVPDAERLAHQAAAAVAADDVARAPNLAASGR